MRNILDLFAEHLLMIEEDSAEILAYARALDDFFLEHKPTKVALIDVDDRSNDEQGA